MNLIENIYENTEILTKIRTNTVYAQNLYAALCNNDLVKFDPWLILQNKIWNCSWRAAGRHVADLRNCGEDYMDYYCSGSADGVFQNEGIVTPEILEDLKKIDWTVINLNTFDS